MAGKPPRTASRHPSGSAKTQTKTEATGTVLPVVNPLDLWYLCEKARYAKLNPYRRARDLRPMYQRAVTQLIRADNELFKYRFPYCGEVGFDMTKSPPEPLMSKKENYRPSRFPLSHYKKISSQILPQYNTLEVNLDLLSKDELEQQIALPLPGTIEKGIWLDVQGGVRGLLRIPDVLRLRSFTQRGKSQYSQPNLACVIEMKFPGDSLSDRQQTAYTDIAGDPLNLRLLMTSRCESPDNKKLRRDWMDAAKKEPVYVPVGEAMSLRTRAAADPYAVFVGMIDAEHEAARRELEVRPPPLGTPIMTAAPDVRAIAERNRRAQAQMEMTLAAPFAVAAAIPLAAGGAYLVGGGSVATETTVIANAGAKVIQFDRYLGAARAARVAGATTGAATAASKLAAQPTDIPAAPPNLSPEDRRMWEAYQVWAVQQSYRPRSEQYYLFWPDAPETK